MTFVTLIHPEDSFTIPVHQAISKCSLFENNSTLTISPYRIPSSVSLSIFREFISALEGNSVKISTITVVGLNRLCDELGFTDFSSKLCRFFEGSESSKREQPESFLPRMRSGFLKESFEFIVNGTVIESEVSKSAALFPTIREQLSVDGCARKFFVNDSRIESTDIHSLELILSDEITSKEGCQRTW
jgi:hypothetical protein